MLTLGVNLDHIATLRQARRITEPNLLQALEIATKAKAHQITIHLREDRRHIQDFDLFDVMEHSKLPVNVECANDDQIIETLCRLRPFKATLVPERREEVTTEGGLDMNHPKLESTISKLKEAGIKVAAFINPDPYSIERALALGADGIELHTGAYANIFLMLHDEMAYQKNLIDFLSNLSKSRLQSLLDLELKALQDSARLAHDLGLEVYAGHGLNTQNLGAIAKIPEIIELNIGHSIIARSVFIGLGMAIEEILDEMRRARG